MSPGTCNTVYLENSAPLIIHYPLLNYGKGSQIFGKGRQTYTQ